MIHYHGGRHSTWQVAVEIWKRRHALVSYADPHAAVTPAVARALTRQQSEAVCDYLKSQYAIQKMGWFSSRKVTPLGMGVAPPPVPETEPLPPARTEVLVFVPQE